MPIRPITPEDVPAIDAFLAAVAGELGSDAVGERKVLALARRPAGMVATGPEGVVGVAPWVGDGPRTVEVAARTVDTAAALLDAVVAASPGIRLRAWTLRGRFASVFEAAGFDLERELLEMCRPLPADPVAVPEGLVLRGFRPDDVDAWLRVNNRAFAGHAEQGDLSPEDFADRTARSWWDPDGLRLAEVGRTLAGYCWTKVRGDGVGEIYAVAVDPGFRGRGLGTVVMGEGMRHLAAVGCTEVRLFVAADNASAVALYESLGFDRVGVDLAWRRDPQPNRI